MPDDREPPLSHLRRDEPPAADLKERVLQTMQARGMVGRRNRVPWGWAVAAGLGLFAAGLALGRREGPATAPQGQRYALLLYDPASFDKSIPEANLVAEYRDWAISLGDRLSLGEKLGTDERLLRQEDSEGRPTSADGGVGPLGGLFIVRAGSWDEAMAIARSCPHLRHGGVVAVRRIEET
jgi:hypothetical protein